jgi:hypothetical protein
MTVMLTKDFGAGINELNTLITGDLYKRVDATNAASVLGWGTLLKVVHLVPAIRTLHVEEQCATAMPLFRSLLEYMVGTIWLADAGQDAVDVLNQGLLSSHEKLEKHLEAKSTDWRSTVPAEAVAAFAATRAVPPTSHPDNRLLSFAHLLMEYDLGDYRPLYDSLSSWTHLSSVGAQQFFSMSGGVVALSLTPHIDEPVDCLIVCLKMQFDTMLAYNQLLTGDPWRGALYRIAARYGLEVKHRKRLTTP